MFWGTIQNTKLYIFADINGDVINVATGVSVRFACTRPDPPTWFVNGRAAVTEGVCYRWKLRRGLLQIKTQKNRGAKSHCHTSDQWQSYL